MRVQIENKWPISEQGTDIYLYLDHSFISNNAAFTQYVFGKEVKMSNTDAVVEYRDWVRSAYANAVREIVSALDLKSNMLAVTILGREQYGIIGLTNDREALMDCIDPDEFDVSKEYDARIGINMNAGSHYNIFEEVYDNALEIKTKHPRRKAVALIITQTSKSFGFCTKDWEKTLESVKKCANKGIGLITIGIKSANVSCEDLITFDETKMLSTNKKLSTIGDYDSVLKHLREIVQTIGGDRDYWWDAQHTYIPVNKIFYLEKAGLTTGHKDALCFNELGKMYYYGVCVCQNKSNQQYTLQLFENKRNPEKAEDCFKQAANQGVSEAKLYLKKIVRERHGQISEAGIVEDAQIMGIPIKEIHDSTHQKKTIPKWEFSANICTVISLVLGLLALGSAGWLSVPSVVLLGFAHKEKEWRLKVTAFVINSMAFIYFILHLSDGARVFMMIVIVTICFAYAGFANPRWKMYKNSSKYGSTMMRLMIGLPPWITLFTMMFGKWSVAVVSAVITALLLLIPFMHLRKDGFEALNPTILLLFASMGVYSRFVMTWTIVGIPLNHMQEAMATLNDQEFLEYMFSGEEDTQLFSLKELLDMSSPSKEDRYEPQEERTEVYKTIYHDGWVNHEKMKVNSSGDMYYDPDDEEWHKINK